MHTPSVRLTTLSLLFATVSVGCGDDSLPDNQVDASRPDANAVEAAPPLEGAMIDDFEDGDDKPLLPTGGWYKYDDKSNGGGSSIECTGAAPGTLAANGPGFQSTRSIEVNASFDQGTLTYPPFVGFGVWLAEKTAPLDVSAYAGVAYTYKGAAHRVRLETFEVADYDFLGTAVPASADWSTMIVPFTQLFQEGFGKKVTFNPLNFANVSFQMRGNTGPEGKLAIDNLMFLTRLPNQEPDMPVMPPQPPAQDPVPSTVITHPAQARARAYLSRGYNITNWLEQDRFSGFTYDQAYVQKLAAAGFKGLRLPIDLDRYIVSSTGTGNTLDVVIHDDLFTVLDAFLTWTAAAGLSLTIDYHQYNSLLDLSKPDSIDKAVAVWGKVAARYAGNSREDLFYELLNEPELSFAGTPPTQAEWTAIAERMIAAIRASDTVHSIIFGDIGWYGIGYLSKRTPLSDTNVVYAFHSYEPFIFTHQGADWANMSGTHDLPYPYSAERWSTYMADLGFNASMPSWIISAAQNYYRTGNRAALYNPIAQAKRWAVTHNVPVICNEFGAYDRTSRLSDRARYLTDVVSIFEELDIPWQQWFMIMDAQGNVVPEYQAALHLGR